jgi:MoaA/NifB/PqqE/SkfB family radical SAM enzyme
VLGSLTGGIPSDRFGRKPTLLWIGMLYIVSALGSALAWNVEVFILARFIGGIGIGISTVVGATNVMELPALGRLAREVGVDWLKIEETYPATPFARLDVLPLTAPALSDAMAALRDVLAGSPLVLVDHIAPPTACVCTGDPRALAFRVADDFANRATFRPCRTAWEQAAIDADGTVHAIDYAGPTLGNLLDAPMLALWNAPPVIALRGSAMADRASQPSSCCAGRPNG